MYNGWWSIKENIHGNVVFLNISKDLQDLFFLGFQLKLFMKLMMKLTINTTWSLSIIIKNRVESMRMI